MRTIFGGLGLGVLCAILLASAAAPASNSSPPAGSGYGLGADPGYGMRSWEDLYPGLNLTPDQKHQLADIRVETLREVCAARDDLSVPAQERMRRISEARRIGREREMAVLTPQQREYMAQHPPAQSWLLTGQGKTNPSAPHSAPTTTPPSAATVSSSHPGYVPGVSNLTREQADQIAAIRSDTQRRVRIVQRDRTLTPQQRSTSIEQIQRDGHDRVMDVLTPTQRAEFESQYHQSTHRNR